MRTILLAATTAFLLAACTSPAPTERAEVSVPPPPSVGDITQYHDCKATPTGELDGYEQCVVRELKRESCTPASDCVLTCMASPQGRHVGGGCDHVCFGYGVHHKWESRPPAMDSCAKSTGGGA